MVVVQITIVGDLPVRSVDCLGVSGRTTCGTEFGADAKIGVTQSLTMDLTVNTDFAQAEVDDQQVNLTRFPLFFPEKRGFFLENAGVFSVGARGTYADIGKLNAGSKDFGYRATATYVDQFADDTIGVALSASYLNEPYQIQEGNAWGYAPVTVGGQTVNVIGGSKSYVTSTTLKRLGLSGTLQLSRVSVGLGGRPHSDRMQELAADGLRERGGHRVADLAKGVAS